MKIIGIDVDGVLACFFKRYEELVVETAGVDLFPARYPDILPPCWNWPEHYGYTSEVMKEVWGRIKGADDFWLTLSPLQGAQDFLFEVQALPDSELYFITDRPGVNAQWQTAVWLHLMGVEFPSVIISRKGKGAACRALGCDYYIDDKAENIVSVINESPDTMPMLLNYPYNQHIKIESRVDSLKEALGVIRG